MLSALIKRLLSDKHGNVGTMFALMALPVMIVMGGAVDVLRLSNSKGKLQSAVDSGVLAAASLSNDRTPEETIIDFVNSNLGSDSTIQNVQVFVEQEELFLNKKLVKARAEAEVPMSFLRLVGQSTIAFQVEAEAVESQQDLEISMVLDISSSMRGNRLVNLRSAASNFVDQMLVPSQIDLTSINLVPFGGVVNIGSLYDGYVVNDADALINPNRSQYAPSADIPNGNFKFTHAGTGGNGNCIELQKEDFDIFDLPANSRPQVPHFWRFTDFNPWCPDVNSAAVWNTNNISDLKNRINNLSLSDGTGMDHGIAWGAKALSPQLRGKLGGDFSDRPQAYSGNNGARKIMVLMTDGGITSQQRPRNPNLLSTHTRGKNNRNRQVLYSAGGSQHQAGHNNATGRFKQVCNQLRDEGVIIYTIGFQISANSKPEHLLQYCATNPANYYLVESLDIGQAFNAIASSINKLRISG